MFYKRQVRRTFKLVNPKHEDQLKIFSIFYLNNRDTRYWNMTSYNWICEDSKKKKKKKKKNLLQTSKHIFQICIDCIVYIHLAIFFIYIAYIFKSYFLLCSNMLLLPVCWTQVFLCVVQTDMLTSKYLIIQWISMNGNST